MFIKKTHFWVFFIRENAYNFAAVNQLSLLWDTPIQKKTERSYLQQVRAIQIGRLTS